MRVFFANNLLTRAFVWIIVFLTVRIQAESSCIDMTNQVYIVKNIGLKASQFWQGKADDITECAAMCLRRKLCKSINYDMSSKLCELNSGLKSNIPTKSGKFLVYSEFNDWPKDIDPHCHHRPCAEDEVCIPGSFLASAKTDSNGCTYSCMSAGRAVCPMPTFGVSSGRTVGSVNVLTCGKGYVGGGSATCLPNKKWDKDIPPCKEIYGHLCSRTEPLCSQINLNCRDNRCSCDTGEIFDRSTMECVTDCGEAPEVPGATLSGTKFDRERVYSCDTDLKPKPGTGNGIITCNKDGKWEPTGFQCYGLRLARLPLGTGNNGYLEMFDGGQWNTVVVGNWNWRATSVACKEISAKFIYGGTFHIDWLGTNVISSYSPYPSKRLISDTNCTGNETSLVNCNKYGIEDGALSYMALTCFTRNASGLLEVGLAKTDSLVMDSTLNAGILVVNLTNTVGAVCYNQGKYQFAWTDKTTQVACRSIRSQWNRVSEMGINNTTPKIIFRKFSCDGDEPHLLFCGNEGWKYETYDFDTCNSGQYTQIECN